MGAVFAQVALGEILAQQRPMEYWESHAQAAWAERAAENGREAIDIFVEAVRAHVSLRRSVYFSQLEQLLNEGRLLRVPSSAWLAMKVRGGEARRFLFGSVEAEHLRSVQACGHELGVIETKVECVQDDGVMLLRGANMVLPEQWTGTTLALLDAAEPDALTDAGITAMDLWCEIVNRGIAAILPYQFRDEEMRADRRGLFVEKIEKARLKSRNVYSFEGARARSGAGFGLLTANLRDDTILNTDRRLFELQNVYVGMVMEDGRDESWRYVGRAG